MADRVPVFELYQSGMYSKSLIYLRLDRHLLPAVCCRGTPHPRRLDHISRIKTFYKSRCSPAQELTLPLDNIDGGALRLDIGFAAQFVWARVTAGCKCKFM